DLPPSRMPELWALLAPEGPLRRYALAMSDESVEAPVAATRVKLTTRLAQHLVGDDTLADGMKRVQPRVTLDDSLVPEVAAHQLVARVRRALQMGESLAV